MALDASAIAAITGGEVVSGPADASATSVAIDSRTASAGSAFFAFDGENLDGHAFAAHAVARGATVLVVTRPEAAEVTDEVRRERREDVAVVRVDDATRALQALASEHRSHLTCPVIGITGSSGKTTTKDLLRSVLATRFDVVATEGNRNNELGVPLTILEASEDTGAIVVEMAMRGPGQIEALCDIARPTIGLVTNVGHTHIELLGSEQAIALAKAELVRAIPASGGVFLNGDDDWAHMMADLAAPPVTFYGTAEGADVRARDVTVDASGRPSFVLETPSASVQAALAIPGRHNAYNAAAAAAVGLGLGLSLPEVARGLAEARTSAMRMQVVESADGITVIDDAYNANPAAMRVALRTLADFAAHGRRVAVLGDMAELGELTEKAHRDLGECVASSDVDLLVTVGPRATGIAQGAIEAGMGAAVVHSYADAEEATAAIAGSLHPGDVVLVKASRVVGLERVVEGIINPHA